MSCAHERILLVYNQAENNKSNFVRLPIIPSILNLSCSTCLMECHLTQSARLTECISKWLSRFLSPACMRQAVYEKALLDIDGDKDLSTNELFSDPAPHLVSHRLHLFRKTTLIKWVWFCENVGVFVMIFLAKFFLM